MISKKRIDQPPLPRAVVLLGWVSFFADVSSEMAYPVLPVFLIGVLGASKTTLGTIEGAAACLVAFVTAWSGARSDRTRRRTPLVRLGYFLPVAGKAMIAVASAWPLAAAGRLVDRFGKGVRSSPRDALIGDAVDPADRGRAFGFHRAMDTAGALIGVVLAGVFLAFTNGDARALRLVLAVSAAVGLVGGCVTFFVREAPKDRQEPIRSAPPPLPPGFRRAVFPLVLFALANSSDAFLLLAARERGLSAGAVVWAYALMNVSAMLLAYPAGALSDRIGRKRILILGWAIYAVVYAGFAFTNAIGIWPLFFVYGAHIAMTDGVGKAFVLDHAPKEAKGTALGVFARAQGLAMFAASVLAGFLWDRFGARETFLAGAAIALLASVVLVLPRPAAPARLP